MKLHEKIRHLRRDVLKLSLKGFYEKLKGIFGSDALTYHSLCRLEKGYRSDIRLKSLYQICTGLGVSLKELREGTEEEESKIVTIGTIKDRKDNKYIYNDKAFAEILSGRHLKFLAIELTILPGGATEKEEDPLDTNKFEKLIIMLQGEMIVHVGKESHRIKKDDTLSFSSNIPHHFENPSDTKKAIAIIIQDPKSY